MRLSEWRKTAPNKESMSNRVLAVLRPVLVDLGADSDAECWVYWGDDPEQRYTVLAPTVAGLVTVAVRPSASASVVFRPSPCGRAAEPNWFCQST